jgi:hypothetical protein
MQRSKNGYFHIAGMTGSGPKGEHPGDDMYLDVPDCPCRCRGEDRADVARRPNSGHWMITCCRAKRFGTIQTGAPR